ncbi:MAG: hypothetical protein KGZ65_04200 [Sphingomonadales bacterium]|nr:hypothetical protein [Sphingomonadaceae bacterium]MBS3930415.1 hypothetical protein [Sphingomonadales bacterium]
MNPPEDSRFQYAHGLVWDRETEQGVPRAKNNPPSCDRVAALSCWTPKPRVMHVYRLPNGQHVWQWEPQPPGGQYAR